MQVLAEVCMSRCNLLRGSLKAVPRDVVTVFVHISLQNNLKLFVTEDFVVGLTTE